MMRKASNIFEYVDRYKTDEGFEPRETCPTKEMPGSKEKIEVYMDRLQKGEELNHPKDAKVFEQTKPRILTSWWGI